MVGTTWGDRSSRHFASDDRPICVRRREFASEEQATGFRPQASGLEPQVSRLGPEASSISSSGILRPDRPKSAPTILKCFGAHDLFWDAKPKTLASRIVPTRRFASRNLLPSPLVGEGPGVRGARARVVSARANPSSERRARAVYKSAATECARPRKQRNLDHGPTLILVERTCLRF